MPVNATYNRSAGTREDPGGQGGAIKVQKDWWDQKDADAPQQGMVNGAANWANGQAALGQSRGPTAVEDETLARNEANGAGGHQQGAIGLAATLARGSQPSVAAQQLQSGLNQASAQQASMGRSARGGAAMAVAGANQQANTANLQQNAWTQGGILRARDMAAGRQMLGTGLGQMQEQDQKRIGQANQMTQFNAEQNDKYSLGMGAAAVGLGNTANGAEQNDLLWHQGGMTSVEAQSEAEQQNRHWLADAESQRVAANEEDE